MGRISQDACRWLSSSFFISLRRADFSRTRAGIASGAEAAVDPSRVPGPRWRDAQSHAAWARRSRCMVEPPTFDNEEASWPYS
jgi:hypothetical protein